MFENIIAQAAAGRLRDDALSGRLAPSMLFFGPAASGKGSAALELARALSCEGPKDAGAPWNCRCPSCESHRALLHPDLAMIGPRAFAAEIAAARAAFLRDPGSAPGCLLFVRSVRKLLGRFSPSVWEHESKSGKASPLALLQSIQEELSEFERPVSAREKLSESIAKNSFKLEDDCVSEAIPIAQVRRCAYWSRLSPTGMRKTLVIENAERMREDARNALLKLLEEPPETLRIVMTAQRRESVMPTILSRLRPYRFSARSAGEEAEILRRVFRDPRYSTDAPTEGEGGGGASGAAGLVASYLDSFTPQPAEKLLPLAAFFVAAVTRAGLSRARGAGAREVSPALNALGSYCARIAENSGLERADEAGRTLAVLSSATSGFEGRAFPRFLSLCLNLVSEALAHCESPAEGIRHREMWKKRVESAQAAHSGLNQRPDLALESLFHRLSEDVARGGP